MELDAEIKNSKYDIIKSVGSGAYSVVWCAMCKETNEMVAIKKVNQISRSIKTLKLCLREIKLLKHFKHDNIIGLRDVLKPTTQDAFDCVYLVFEWMPTDLSRIISSSTILTDEHNQMFIYQLLCGLKYIHSADVIHRDLKPANLLITQDCTLKICDFGMGRGKEPASKEKLRMTNLNLTTTRWYRAPEGLCSAKNYSSAVDIWSVGCILAELIAREALFMGGDDEEMLELILDYLGTPNEEEILIVEDTKRFEYLKQLPKKPPISMTEKFPRLNDAKPLALDLLQKMLVFNPVKRITVDQALKHPYFKELHDPDEEPNAEIFVGPTYNNIESPDELKDLIYKEITDAISEIPIP